MKIICLDIDDCLYPVVHDEESIYLNRLIALKQFELNLLKIQKICLSKNIKIHITSSWGQFLEFDEFGILQIINKSSDYYIKGYLLIKKYLNSLITGIDKYNNRTFYIESIKEKNRVLVLDDIDLKHVESQNCKYIKVNNHLDNLTCMTVLNFFKKDYHE